ncbi:MAG: hypothetical protein GC171_03230 [Terrimonas sp.]|nr:hypothetical protein [Terrimonas sp.]
MKKKFSLLLALIGWLAVIAQFVIMTGNRKDTLTETIIRFFSYFTILTNTMVALYGTYTFFSSENKTGKINRPGTLTAITVYITIVGGVYQFVLRQLWQPEGLQRIVDELLHAVIPVLVIIFWWHYEQKKSIRYTQIPRWLIFPFIYMVCILLRGNISGFYPYPFVNAGELGWPAVQMNAAALLLLFILVSAIFIFIGKMITRR